MIKAAKAWGHRYCAITDHAPALAMQHMTRDKAIEQRALVPDLAAQCHIEALHGSELNIAADGSLDWDDEFLAGFDHRPAQLGRAPAGHQHLALGPASPISRRWTPTGARMNRRRIETRPGPGRGDRPGPGCGGQDLAIGIFLASSTAGLGIRISRIPSL
jgi:hypothetical protein